VFCTARVISFGKLCELLELTTEELIGRALTTLDANALLVHGNWVIKR